MQTRPLFLVDVADVAQAYFISSFRANADETPGQLLTNHQDVE